MKILFVTPFYKPYLGGIERVIEKLSQQYIQAGHEVTVLTSKWEFPNSPGQKRVYHKDWPDEELLETGEKVYRIKSFPTIAPSFYQVPLVWFSPLAFKKILNSVQPDAIQLMGDRWFWGNLWSTLFSGKAQVSFAVIFHELTKGKDNRSLLWIFKQLLRPINILLGRLVDWVHVVTALEADMVRSAYWIPRTKIRIIPWGVEFEEVLHANFKAQSKVIEILAVGRISEHKGQDWLAEVVKDVAAITNIQVILTLAGKDDGMGETLKERFPDTEHFSMRLPGAVSDAELATLYQRSDIFGLFPEYESFGLVYIEAMSYGLPVITHDVGAVREVLGDNAMIIDQYNKAQAKVVLAKLLEDTAFRQELGQRGNAFVRETYLWESAAKKFLEEYGGSSVIS